MNASNIAFQRLALPASRTTIEATRSLAALRAHLTALTFPSPYLSEAEKLLANHRIHECEDARQLTRWLKNTTATLARRHPACPSTTSLAGHVV